MAEKGLMIGASRGEGSPAGASPPAEIRSARGSSGAKRLARRLLPFVGLCLAIYWIGAFAITHVPLEEEGRIVSSWNVPHADKLVHMAIYTGLAFLLSVWFGVRRRVRGAVWVALVVSCVLASYAALDELTQGSVGRDPDVRDWFADMAGINLGLFGFFAVRRWLRR